MIWCWCFTPTTRLVHVSLHLPAQKSPGNGMPRLRLRIDAAKSLVADMQRGTNICVYYEALSSCERQCDRTRFGPIERLAISRTPRMSPKCSTVLALLMGTLASITILTDASVTERNSLQVIQLQEFNISNMALLDASLSSTHHSSGPPLQLHDPSQSFPTTLNCALQSPTA